MKAKALTDQLFQLMEDDDRGGDNDTAHSTFEADRPSSEANFYASTPSQLIAQAELEAQGFNFSNWTNDVTPSHEVSENDGVMVFIKRGATRHSREYREIWPDGSVH